MQIFELVGSILLKSNGVTDELDKIDKKAKGTGTNFDDVFGKIGKAALKVGAILGVSMGFKEMIDGASASQQKLAQMDSVLQSTGGAAGMTKDELLKLADAQSKVSLNSKGTNIATENLMLTFTKIGKDVFPQALGVISDMSQALGQDMSSSATMVSKALQDPIKGITALSKVGVNFTAQQKEQIKTLVESGHTMEAQKIILSELGTEYGGSSLAASKTFGGQLTILKNQISGVGTQIGTVLIPYLTDFTTKVNTYMPKIKQTITDMINYIVPKFQDWIKLIGQIANELLPSFGKSSDDAKTKIADLAKNGIDLITTGLTWLRDHSTEVKVAIGILTGAWVIQKGILLVLNVQQGIHNAALAAGAIASGAETIAIVALYIAEGVLNTATKIASASMVIFNAVMDKNPIAITVIALATLGVAIYEIVKHWDAITTAIQKAWDWLNIWNKTPAQNKQANVEMTQKGLGVTSKVGANASGTDNWIGGLTRVNEAGGEIMNLPSGTQIIPHDVSMQMAKSNDSKSIVIKVDNLVKIDGNVVDTNNIKQLISDGANEALTNILRKYSPGGVLA